MIFTRRQSETRGELAGLRSCAPCTGDSNRCPAGKMDLSDLMNRSVFFYPIAFYPTTLYTITLYTII
jgi:hypothetical protein